MAAEPATIVVKIPARFSEFAETALLKLQIRHPDVSFLLADGGIGIFLRDKKDAARLRRDVLHAVYAEKIFAETLDMRRSLMAAVTAR